MKINQIASNKYLNRQNFCGSLIVNSDSESGISKLNTKWIQEISKDKNDSFKTVIDSIYEGKIQVKHNLADVLQAYTAACQNGLITVDISSNYANNKQIK